MAEGVLEHVLFLKFLLHDHFVDLSFTNACLVILTITCIESKWLGNGDTVSSLSTRLDSKLVDVIVSSDTLAS